MNSAKTAILVAVGFIAVVLLYQSLFIVREYEQVILTQFGKPVDMAIDKPGLKFKVPFIQKVNRFEKRYLEWDGDPNQVPTKDKRFIWVDAYARWRISDPLLFFQRVREERSAQSRLDDILDGEVRNTIASHDLEEIVRSTNREPEKADIFGDEEGTVFSTIKTGRAQIMDTIQKKAAPRTLELGIELLDVRFKRINYVDEVQRKIFERMISERKKVADRYRSEGQGEASKILGDRERDLRRIRSEAFKESQEIKGKADAEATSIYAGAYNRSPETRDFYRFVMTLEAYRKVLSEKDWLLLSTNSDLFKLLESDDFK